MTNGRHAVLLYLIQKKTKVPGDTRQNSLDKWPICCITLPDTEKKVPEDTRQNSLDKWSICCITLPDTEKQTKVPEDTRQNTLDKWPTCCITLPDTEKKEKQKYLAIHDKTVLTNGRHAVLLYLIQKKAKSTCRNYVNLYCAILCINDYKTIKKLFFYDILGKEQNPDKSHFHQFSCSQIVFNFLMTNPNI